MAVACPWPVASRWSCRELWLVWHSPGDMPLFSAAPVHYWSSCSSVHPQTRSTSAVPGQQLSGHLIYCEKWLMIFFFVSLSLAPSLAPFSPSPSLKCSTHFFLAYLQHARTLLDAFWWTYRSTTEWPGSHWPGTHCTPGSHSPAHSEEGTRIKINVRSPEAMHTSYTTVRLNSTKTYTQPTTFLCANNNYFKYPVSLK